MALSRREMLALGLASIPAATRRSRKASAQMLQSSGMDGQKNSALDRTIQMVSIPSYSHMSSKPIADYVETAIKDLGFVTERLEYTDTRSDPKGILKVNVIGKKGNLAGGFALSGHMDTVPADTWTEGSPFQPFVRDGRLYGRGVCDMKGPIACMMEAASRFPVAQLKKSIYLVFSSDEEIGGGASRIVARSQLFREIVTNSVPMVIGEPTLMEVVYSHKAGWSFTATAHGRAGHTSRDIGFNANLKLIPFLAEMKKMHDEVTTDRRWFNTEYDPPHIVWNIRMKDGTTASNIYPPLSTCTVSCRTMPKVDLKALADRVKATADAMGLDLTMGNTSPRFYYVDPNSPYIHDLLAINGKTKPLTAPYGTDAGSYFPGGAKILAISGPGSIDQAHTDDEWINLAQLDAGVDSYVKMIKFYCM